MHLGRGSQPPDWDEFEEEEDEQDDGGEAGCAQADAHAIAKAVLVIVFRCHRCPCAAPTTRCTDEGVEEENEEQYEEAERV